MRKKPNPFVVADLAAADRAMARLAEIKRTEEARLNAAVDKMKAHAKEHTAAVLAESVALEAALATFAETKKDVFFSKARSQALNFGVIGFRRSSELKPQSRKTWTSILERIKALSTGEELDPFKPAIRIKEEVNRDVLKDWPEERLDAVGARIVDKDTFYYELRAEQIKEAAA